MRLRSVALVAALASVSAFVACTLNPQPLPPRDEFSGEPSDSDAGGGLSADGGAFNSPEAPSSDAAIGAPTSGDADGGDDGGERSDGGDGGSTDASDDGG